MKNIFLVKSPLQLLNAIEAKHYFQLNDNDCFLIIMGDRKSYPQMMSLATLDHQWSSIVLMNRVGLFLSNPWFAKKDLGNIDKLRKSFLRSSIFTIRRLNRLSKTISDVERVFIGDNNNPFMRHFVNSVKHKDTIFLDDGTATLEIARQRLEGGLERAPQKLHKKVKLAAKRIFQGLKNHQADKVIFFTAYKIEVRKPDQLIINKFAYLRQKVRSMNTDDAVYFLGSPLSEVGLMSEKSYVDQLGIVRSKYAGKDFVYVAHRRESKQKLDVIQKLLDVRVSFFNYPVEYQFAIIGPHPEIVVSFITSALDNLNIILGDSMRIISFRLLEGSYANKDRINAIYDHYQSNSSDFFKVKTLE
ncbi:MAG TPA: hypothetical protein VIQ03_03115 [Gammaproteobacteria bacterium]